MIDNPQNRHSYKFALSSISKMSEKDKDEKIRELRQIGYDYNANIHVMITLDTIIPYDFILFCLLIEDREKIQTVSFL